MEEKKNDSCSLRIRKALSERNMKQSELCRKTGIPKSAMSEYISGAYEPKQDRIFIIAQALNVDPVWLMGFNVPMEKKKEVSPEQVQLSEGEKALLELFKKVPEDQQRLVLQMIRAALGNREQ